MVSYQYGYVPISRNANWRHEKLDLTNVPVTKNGIISVYLTNESSVGHVDFDDIKVTLHETNIVQENVYYPFDLPLDDNPFFYTFVPNRFLYQGKEWQTALALNLYDFHARQYDPALGRWLAMDLAMDRRWTRPDSLRVLITGWGIILSWGWTRMGSLLVRWLQP